MIKKEGIYQFKIKWKAVKVKWLHDDNYELEYEKVKEKGKSLKDFLIEEKANDAKINLEFIIDGTDFANWLNLNYFEDKKAIGFERFENNLTYALNNLNYNQINFIHEKIGLKKMLGQSLKLDDCIDYYKSKNGNKVESESSNKIKINSKSILLEEDSDVILFCSACCGDRMCGYIGLQIYHNEKEVIWHIRLYEEITEFRFEKKSYFTEFREYVDLVNNELRQKGIKEINIEEKGKEIKSVDEKLTSLCLKFKILKIEELKKIDIITVFKNGNEHEMDTIISLAISQGIKEDEILKWLEEDYSKLSKVEKDSISWKIIDRSEYLDNLDLNNMTLVKKASLLYK